MDRLYGGLGADRFVFDLNVSEIDEIMDFNPEQGDTVLLQFGQSNKNDELQFDFKNFNSDDVRVNPDGDLEIESEHEIWIKVVRLKQTDLEVAATQLDDKLVLRFSRKF